MTHKMQYGRWLAAAGALCALGRPGMARADLVTVTPSVTFSSGLYHYDYTITNNGPTDLLDVTLQVLPGPSTIQNLSVPDGFLGSFDPGLGLVDFLGNVDMNGLPVDFTPNSTLDGFMFDSPYKPSPSFFSALKLDGTSLLGVTSAPVPEAGSAALLGAILTSGGIALRRRGRARRG